MTNTALGGPSTTATTPTRGPWLQRGRQWLHRILLANLVVEVLIVVTGGLVRLTGSGLGCPTWPQCVPGSYVPVAHQAQGFHKYIEFGNRTLTSVVVVAALASIVAVYLWTDRRRSLVVPAFLVLGGVATQAVVGGISVLTGLNPFIVAAHFLISMVLVATSTYLVLRAREPGGPTDAVVPLLVRRLALATVSLGGVVLVLGTVVTGSGPHSGDAQFPARFGFDPRSVSWLHADAVMLFLGLVVATWVATRLVATPGRSDGVARAWAIVLGVTLLQGVIGYTQYFTGLPEALVALHMLGASLLVVSLVGGLLALRRPAGAT